MNASLSATTDNPAPRQLDLRRLLLVAVFLPACIAAANYALLGRIHEDRSSSPLLFGQFAWYVVQVGIVGFAVGRGISQPLLKWIVFGWILLLINLLTSAQAMNAGGAWRSEPFLAPAALMAGQMGLCVVWAFFGDTKWTSRWPGMILATEVLYFVWLSLGSDSQRQMWTELLLLQVVTLSVLCGLLRLFGFCLLVLAEDEVKLVADDPRRRLQFGIKHVLIWTTALAILLGIAKGMDLLRWQVAQELVRYGLLWKLTVATTSAMVIIVALWVALGRGHWALRYSAGLIFTLLIGGGLGIWSLSNAAAARRAPMAAWYLQVHWELFRLYEVGWWWLGWLFLCGGLLAATLIILRVVGYRLVRQA